MISAPQKHIHRTDSLDTCKLLFSNPIKSEAEGILLRSRLQAAARRMGFNDTQRQGLYRKTFTDYIDDVSTKYIDPASYTKYLNTQDATLAYKLSDKSIGIIYPGMTRYPAGTQRGDTKNGDTYFSVVMKIGVRLGEIYESSFAKRAARQTRCPSVY